VAIVQISKITHRRGLDTNLPQLGSAELGWALDTRRLLIGNGTLAEGAPSLGNTELLTEHSNLLELMTDAYIFREGNIEFPVTTGVDANNPISRDVQSRLDEIVSVAGFGATGDGTDQTAAIDRALTELFRRFYTNPKSRIRLYWPPGTYLYAGVLQIPAFATMFGAGKDSTFVLQAAANGLTPFIQVVKILEVGGAQFVKPTDIQISDMTFDTNSFDNDVLLISSATDITFDEVRLAGGTADTTTIQLDTAVIRIDSPDLTKSARILFNRCDLTGATNGFVADHDMSHVTIQNGSFSNLFKGAVVGKNSTGSGSSVLGPRGVRIINNEFDKVSLQGIHVFRANRFVSSFNYFRDVGNTQTGPASPVAASAVVTLGDFGASEPALIDPATLEPHEGNMSIGDQFDRSDADAVTFPKIDIIGTASYAITDDVILHGSLKSEPGRNRILTDNTAAPTNTGLSLAVAQYKGITVDFVIERGANQRVGTLTIAQTTTNQTMDEEFTDAGTGVGVTFTLLHTAGVSDVQYVTTSTGTDATFRFSVRHFNK